MSEWQPIETAPKQKTILLWCVTDKAEDGSVRNWKMATGWWRESPYPECCGWFWDGHEVKSWDHQPTHWMALPEPPHA